MPSDICIVRENDFLLHQGPPGHPESPDRLRAIHALFDRTPELARLPRLHPKPAGEPALERVHAREMVRAVLGARGKQGWFDGDTFHSEGSVDAALLAAGACIDAALAVWDGTYRRGFVLVRPPGHHATPSRSMGFCLFNNVALAAAAVSAASPAARIAVIDFDLHHGNGTQDLFYSNPNVLFISSHRYPYYPGTGALDEIGEGKGKGTTVNFPLGRPHGDELFLPLYAEIAVPMVRSFAPDILLVSAGFDGHAEDPMAGFRIHTEAYAALAELLIAAAEERGGKILFCLEGGYNPEALAESVGVVTSKLITCPRAPFTPKIPRGEPDSPTLESLRRFHHPFFPNIG